MKYLFHFTILLLLNSCAIKEYPIKGNYPSPPISEVTNTNIDTVWSNLIDFISIRGLSIKLIDKSSGFLVMDDYSFKGLFTTEKVGVIRNPGAYLVTSGFLYPNTRLIEGPDRILGNFNVRIKNMVKAQLYM